MGLDNSYLLAATLVGLGATLAMDIWALALRQVFNIALPNYCFVGRWLLHMPTGKFKHINIAAAGKKPAECKVGWIFYYRVCVTYSFLLIVTTIGNCLVYTRLMPAL